MSSSKRMYMIIGTLSLICTTSVLIACDATVDLVIDSHEVYDYGRISSPIQSAMLTVSFADWNDVAISNEYFIPGFQNNFNRLVVFPELGNDGERKGHLSPIRGPPKSKQPACT